LILTHTGRSYCPKNALVRYSAFKCRINKNRNKVPVKDITQNGIELLPMPAFMLLSINKQRHALL
jgi:hypothetical protein